MLRGILQTSGAMRLTAGLALLVLALGCGSIKITDRDEYKGEKLARPDHILIHDFAATVDDLPDWSDAAKANSGAQATATPEEIEVGRKLGVEMTTELVKRIDEMGLPAERATADSQPGDGDLVIVGYLSSVEEGSGFKRVVIGFGSGAAEVTSSVEGYLSTPQGLRKLGSGGLTSGKGHAPGVVVPLVVTAVTANPIGLIIMAPVKIGTEVSGRDTVKGVGKRMSDKIADELEKKFREQGWIAD